MIRLIAFGLCLLLARGLDAAPLDTTFTYQGELLQSGIPSNGSFDFRLRVFDAAVAGTQVGSDQVRDSVPVAGGAFSVELDIGNELIEDRQLYLEIEVRAAGGGAYTLLSPRQKMTLAPAAGFALGAAVSESALGLAAENLLLVSPTGAAYSTITAALAAVVSPGENNRYLIFVGPGIYQESGPLMVPSFVHLKGSGTGSTIIRSSNSGSTPGPAAATLVLQEEAALSDIAVENLGTGVFGIGVYMSEGVTRATRLTSIYSSAIGAGGTGHYAVYLNDAEPTIFGSRLHAAGAVGFGTAVNAAVGAVNVSGGFPRPLIVESFLIGGGPADAFETCSDNTGTGFGFQGSSAAPVIRRSFICGGHRAIANMAQGIARVEASTISVGSTTGAFMIETSGSGNVLISRSAVSYVGNKYTGTGNMGCIYNVAGNHTALSDGSTPATACN